jgi:hypothetical protein
LSLPSWRHLLGGKKEYCRFVMYLQIQIDD